MARNEFVLAAGNPKAIVLFTARVPQLVDMSKAAAPQLAVFGGLFLLLEWLAIAAWAGTGVQLMRLLARPRPQRWLASARTRLPVVRHREAAATPE